MGVLQIRISLVQHLPVSDSLGQGALSISQKTGSIRPRKASADDGAPRISLYLQLHSLRVDGQGPLFLLLAHLRDVLLKSGQSSI